MSTTPPPTGSGNQSIVGRPVISDYDQALTLAKQLTPDQSLVRANDSAKWAVQTIALVATFLGGFGAIAGLSTIPTRHASLIVWTIALSGLAVSFGIVALLPRFGTIDPNKAQQVDRYFKHLLYRRGLFTIAAFACLLGAIVLAVITSFEIESDPVVPTATLTTGWDGSGTSPVVSADLSVAHAQPGTTIELVVTGPASAGTDPTPGGTSTLASATGTVGQNGTTEVDLKFVPALHSGPFRALATDVSNQPNTTLATASISMPPVFVLPSTTVPSTTSTTGSTTSTDPPQVTHPRTT